LHRASAGGQIEVVRYLVEDLGIDILVKNKVREDFTVTTMFL
jgi:hypothetical protein